MKKIPAHKRCYSTVKRDKKAIQYIVIHNTANIGDTAEGNGNYFKNGPYKWETKSDGTKVKVPIEAGAHFFIDQKGNKVKSIDMNRIAWAVGGSKYSDCGATGGGKMFGKVTNANSVSIELCDIVDKEPSEAMMKSVWKVVKYIRKYCPNAQTIVRHFDVNGKHCPKSMMDEEMWQRFQLRLLNAAIKYK